MNHSYNNVPQDQTGSSPRPEKVAVVRRSFGTAAKNLSGSVLFGVALLAGGMAQAQQKKIPDVLKPWHDWVTWEKKYQDCPTLYNSADKRVCLWPSQLTLLADPQAGSFRIGVTLFAQAWVPLPGSDQVWPLDVRADGDLLAIVQRDGKPSVQLPAGRHQLSGRFEWAEMPQRIAIPRQVGLLSLVVEGHQVPIPNWDARGDVWLKRLRAEVADKDLLSVHVYRVLEDGIPMWLRTRIQLTVSGKSREEQLGWILPAGWRLATVDSPIPVAVDDRGRMKAQVRAGKWTIRADAFRSEDAGAFRFAPDAKPITNLELVGFQAKPEFRMAQVEGIEAVDVAQTTFPAEWRNLPVYQWKTDSPFRLVEKMRGMGLQRPEGLKIHRHFWLDENGHGLTYRDRIGGRMQQIWRLDVADEQQLGAVRIDGQGQLITVDPQTGAEGVEIRNRNLNMEAIGRIDRTGELSATGWQTDADSLGLTLSLPPGWRVFALFGADRVDGDWLTAWSLLDLFLLLIFSLAVLRLWGVKAGLVAFLAFGLAYHEPGSPRFTWLFLLLPLALLRVVSHPGGRRSILAWKYAALALLVLSLIPFVAEQIQCAIYPQLERPGMTYGARGMLWHMGAARRGRARVANFDDLAAQGETVVAARFGARPRVQSGEQEVVSKSKTSNLLYDPKARIQTGPAKPEWDWNQIRCEWNGPVSADQQIRLVLISLPLHRFLTVLRVALLLLLAAILLGVRQVRNPFSKRTITAALLLPVFFLPGRTSAQIPDQTMLDTLRERILEPADAYPHAAEIPSVALQVHNNRLVMQCEIHTALGVAVPLPGRLPAWSPVSVQVDGQSETVVCRRDGYLWVSVPKGVHQVAVEGLLPKTTQWEWAFLLKPRRVSIDAPDWNVTGVRPNGTVEQQVFFTRKQEATAGEAAYDRNDFHTLVAVDRHLEIGLIWQVRSEVTRLCSPGKAVSLKIPLLTGESVLTSNVTVEEGQLEVQLGTGQNRFSWESELPVEGEIRLHAAKTDEWIERWHLVTSPVWNVAMAGLTPVFESDQENLIPIWHPWPGEGVTLTFSKPEAVSGDTITVEHVHHETAIGARQRTTRLKLDVQCSLGSDFVIELDPKADISSLKLDDRLVPVRRDGARLIFPVHPGRQAVEVQWRTSRAMATVVGTGHVKLPVEGSNVTTVMRVPESRWVLWTDGPLRGPAVRFWTILASAVLAACVLGSLSLSPLGRFQWVLLSLGLTQVNVVAAMVVVGWFFLLAWRGRQQPGALRRWRFNFLQIAFVPFTMLMLAILFVVVGEGLLGNPDMFIRGNHSSRTLLQWFQPRAGRGLPEPHMVSISVWFYRLLMLCWALWLAGSLLRWLKWGWNQYSSGGCWQRAAKKGTAATPVPDATS